MLNISFFHGGLFIRTQCVPDTPNMLANVMLAKAQFLVTN